MLVRSGDGERLGAPDRVDDDVVFVVVVVGVVATEGSSAGGIADEELGGDGTDGVDEAGGAFVCTTTR